jgi:hypothetical protein
VRHLLSKLVAGGLSAAVILLWWPRFFPADTAAAWLARGVVWTLSFELMLHALAPLEELLWERPAARRVRHLAAQASVASRTALACATLAIPAALLATAPAPRDEKPPVTAVKTVTEVRRVVVERDPAAREQAPVEVQTETTASDPASRTVPVRAGARQRPDTRERRVTRPAPTRTEPTSTRGTEQRDGGSGSDSAGSQQTTAQPQAAEPRTDAVRRAVSTSGRRTA